MKYSLAIFIGLILYATTGFSQCPSAGDQNFSSQAEIDFFGSTYPTCTVITGDVTIQESSSGDITNLDGLSSIQTIAGNLYISNNNSLPNMNGLAELQTVEGEFYIYENPSLANMAGLGALSAIQGDFFYIGHNGNITNLSGLSSLTTIDAQLYVGYNDNLINSLM